MDHPIQTSTMKQLALFTITSLFVLHLHAQDSSRTHLLDTVAVKADKRTFGITRLKDVDGAGIYAGKKSEVVVIKDITANTATNNSRQIYSKVAGLNIYENDGGAGTQLSIGGGGGGSHPGGNTQTPPKRARNKTHAP